MPATWRFRKRDRRGSPGQPIRWNIMAVYTEVGDDELVRFATEYDIGEILSCKGIAEGIEN